MADTAAKAIGTIESVLPEDFPEALHSSVKEALTDRLSKLQMRQGEK